MPYFITFFSYNFLLSHFLNSSKLYADNRGNAVFLLPGKEKKVVGAELRGTNDLRWHGMAPGSRKDLGCFYVKTPNTNKIVICKSAIDAISKDLDLQNMIGMKFLSQNI